VVTILLVDWRLQWQADPELVSERTRATVATELPLPTLPSEIWPAILGLCRVRELGGDSLLLGLFDCLVFFAYKLVV
jgi:hypothetical protein